ncbi:DUF7116 family protein [Haloarcula nitratireducens]|uniref:Uncharacterized protein n=1 Tax=Haloarcula nitratireducens TaxID=2487749 RepID=A0AAW4P8M1_9EURY|nr:hypothetical protein [Halomicroarcula nitratireducens]MBX0294396.1 hypothetical protein [Halomicroarcula nitratireducens]
MGVVTTSLGERAQSIFDDIGYTVSRTESGLRAEHKWRDVHVTVVEDSETLPETGELRCFVTWAADAPDLRRRLGGMDVAYDWAVIGVREDGGYDVVHP